MITLIFLFMPAEVVIYSVINMALSIIPQVLILGRLEKQVADTIYALGTPVGRSAGCYKSFRKNASKTL